MKTLNCRFLTPESWTIEKTMKQFEVSKYPVKKARSHKKELGILGESKAKTGKVIPRVLLLRYKKKIFIILFSLYHLSLSFACFCISELTSTLISPELLRLG